MTIAYEIEKQLPADAVGMKLYKIDHTDRLIGCELCIFDGGRNAVGVTLRRAAISGRVEIGGEIHDHFADIYNSSGNWEQTVALDARSYKALKTRWMRCKKEPAP